MALLLFTYHIVYLPILKQMNPASTQVCTPSKPLVSVVIVMDPSDMVNDGHKGQSALLMAWNCYCMKHGYRLFYAPKVPMANVATKGLTDSFANRMNQNAFYQGRLMIWRHYLQFTDILIGVDSDSLVIHHEKRLTDFISSLDDHVALQQRQNKGICAGAVMIRNTPKGRAWLDMWIEDTTPHIDMDNGRLHSQILQRYLNFSLRDELVSPVLVEKLLSAEANSHNNIGSYFNFLILMGESIGYSYGIVRFDGIVVSHRAYEVPTNLFRV
jgi:hypothetical protein